MLAHRFSPDALAEFEQRDVTTHDDDARDSPEVIAGRLVEDLRQTGSDGAADDVKCNLQGIQDPLEPLNHLLLLLDAGNCAAQPHDVSAHASTLDRLFASDVATRLLTSSLQENVLSRFELSRNLLLFLVFCGRDGQVRGAGAT